MSAMSAMDEMISTSYELLGDVLKHSRVKQQDLEERIISLILNDPEWLVSNISYKHRLFEKCIGYLALSMLREILHHLDDFSQNNIHLTYEIKLQKLKEIFATVNHGIWTDTMIE